MILGIIYQLFTSLFLLHPVHVSVCNININTDKQYIELSFQLDKNDLAIALSHKYEIDYQEIKDSLAVNQLWIDKYLIDCFQIKIDNKLAAYKHIKTSYSQENLFIEYVITRFKKRVSLLEIENSIFTDLYFDQKNLVIVTMDNRSKGYECNYENRQISINL